MNRKVLVLISAILVGCFFCSVIYANNPFERHITGIINHKDFAASGDSIHTVGTYYYADTYPALLDSINLNTINDLSSGYEVINLHSDFSHILQYEGTNTRINYYEYRNHNAALYAHYMFLFDHNGDLLESLQERPSLYESVHVYYHYIEPNKADSIYYSHSLVNPPISCYKLCYDEAGKLAYSYRYFYDEWDENWFLYCRYLPTYGAEPYTYPAPLDIANYRFYILNGGGFDDSYPIYDRNFAPNSIQFQVWNSAFEYWETGDNMFYGAEVNETNIDLISGYYNSYTGYFFFDEEGTYTHKRVEYTNGDVVTFTMTWSDDVSNDDDALTPTVKQINAYPNPFLHSITIRSNNKDTTLGDISIYNLKGQLIRCWKSIRANELTWDGKDSASNTVSNGIYLIKANQGNQASAVKVIKL